MEDARVHFKLATQMKKICGNLNSSIHANTPNVPKVQFLLATLTYAWWHAVYHDRHTEVPSDDNLNKVGKA